MKKMMFNKKMLVSTLMAITMTATSAVFPVSAATVNRTVSNYKTVTARVTSGSGWQYSLGWKKTSVTITNTSSYRNQPITVRTSSAPYYLAKGRSVKFNISGSNKTAYYKITKNGAGGNRKFRVTTSAGSVYTY